ncbi:MAG TPA: hypothetical protein VK436_09265 [Methanocella sp.]|nr:hypothetical protein [Methanocella sp.]
MVSRDKTVKEAINCLALAGMLLFIISSSTVFACHIWADKSSYRPNSVATLTYDTDMINGPHTVVIQKDGAPVATFDMGENNNNSVTWNCGPEETSYQAKLIVGDEEYSSTCIKVSNDDIAPTTIYSFSKPQKPDGSYDPGVKLSFTAIDNPGGSGVAGIYYWYDECDPKQYSSPLEFNQPGTYTLTFKAVDKSGNLEMTDSGLRTLTFIVTAPETVPETDSASTPTTTTRQKITPTTVPSNDEPGRQTMPVSPSADGNNMTDTGSLYTIGRTNESKPKKDASQDNDLGTLIRVSAISCIAIIAGAGLLIIRRP